MGGQISPSNLTLGSPRQKRSSLMAPSVNVTQQLSELTELIKAYKCRVYSCVTGPHERCIESTVPVKLASLRACILPWRAPTRPSTASRSASHRSTGTRNFPSAKSTSNPSCLQCCAGRVWHLGTLTLKPARTKSASTFLASLAHCQIPSP